MTNDAETNRGQRIGELLAVARSRIDRLDAELLLAHATGKSRTWLLTWPEKTAGHAAIRNFDRLVAQRARGVPLAYLTGEKEFWSLSFRVNEHTLVPRPETERLVQLALGTSSDGVTLDLGTGCGAIACALAHELPGAWIVATDISGEALRVARQNSQRLGLDITLLQTNWLDGLDARCAGTIVANPPYVTDDDPHLDGDGVAFEPRLALTAGADGLAAYRQIAPGAARCLRHGGNLLVEHGGDQAGAIAEILRGAGLVDVKTHADAAGLPRITGARRP